MNASKNDTPGMDKSRGFVIVDLVDYAFKSIISKMISSRATGHIRVMALDSGESEVQNITPFDSFLQIIDGAAEIEIDNRSYPLECGDGFIIPAHSYSILKANQRCKLMLTVIKSGYE
jgi:mannose-6-phosphate isomerase-like protein (cupin superfamily)